jgi:predicted transcriptional regulator
MSEEDRYASILRSVLEELLGSSALKVLEYQLSKSYPETSPYKLLLRDPQLYYNALTSIFGNEGSLIFLKLILKRLITRSGTTTIDPDTLARSLIRGEKDAINTLIQTLEKVANFRDEANLKIIETPQVLKEAERWKGMGVGGN